MTIIAACLNSSGEPDFAATDVKASPDQVTSGEHLRIAEEQLESQGFEGPFVLFDEQDLDRLGWGKIQKALKETFRE